MVFSSLLLLNTGLVALIIFDFFRMLLKDHSLNMIIEPPIFHPNHLSVSQASLMTYF